MILIHRVKIVFLLLLLFAQACKAPEKVRTREKPHKTEKSRHAKPEFYQKMSAKLGIPLNGNENPELLKAATGWLGVPYKYGGQDRRGTDCSGLANAIYLQVYQKSLERSSIDIMNAARFVKAEELSEGDFVFFAIGGKTVNHVGIYISSSYFIHASTSKGVIISSLNEPYYKKYFTGGGRLVN